LSIIGKQLNKELICLGRTTKIRLHSVRRESRDFTTDVRASSSETLLKFSTARFNISSISICFSEYLLSFCMANGKESPAPKQVNEVFTQQISYSRRKMKRAREKLENLNIEVNAIQDLQ